MISRTLSDGEEWCNRRGSQELVHHRRVRTTCAKREFACPQRPMLGPLEESKAGAEPQWGSNGAKPGKLLKYKVIRTPKIGTRGSISF